MTSETNGRRPIHLPPGGGRAYPMGRISSVFKAAPNRGPPYWKTASSAARPSADDDA